MHHVIYTENADRDLDDLEPKTAQRITRKILYYSEQTNPLSYAKKLSTVAPGRYRFRIGDYRAIFKIDSKGSIQILLILRIKHRKDIYFS